MPIFQDPDRQRVYDLWSDDHTRQNEQQVLESSWHTPQNMWKREGSGQSSVEDQTRDPNLPILHANGREELIQYIKKADTSAWPPTRFVCFGLKSVVFST